MQVKHKTFTSKILRTMKYIYPLLGVFLFCHSQASNEAFNKYWFDGAEISHYKLEQVQYGNIYEGSAILIFVTENFLQEKQVKHEYGSSDDAIPVLKLNAVRKFTTGIYDYSMMFSVFSPLNSDSYEHALKLSSSTQEWCGQSFTQINRRKDQLDVSLHSYFQKEGDQQIHLPLNWIEDEILTAIRINPQYLPIGKFDVVPGSFYQRLSHIDLSAKPANGTLYQENGKSFYQLNYEDGSRSLKIEFKSEFPHEILGWTENNGTKDRNGNLLATKATLIKTIKSYYWLLNQPENIKERDNLGL
jgi:hypothetical protein